MNCFSSSAALIWNAHNVGLIDPDTLQWKCSFHAVRRKTDTGERSSVSKTSRWTSSLFIFAQSMTMVGDGTKLQTDRYVYGPRDLSDSFTILFVADDVLHSSDPPC
jgi:hypothetical protein